MGFGVAVLAFPLLLWIGSACASSSEPRGAPPPPPPSEAVEPKLPGDSPSSGFTICQEPRPEACTREYVPVCAHRNDGSLYTAGNACTACSDEQALGHRPGACR